MTSSTRFRINKKVVHEAFEDELVIINLDNGNYYTLTGSGAEMWRYIERRATVREVVDAIAERYTAERSALQSAVDTFLGELQQEELISLDGSAPAAQPPEGQSAPNAIADRLPFDAPALHKYTDMEQLLTLDPIHEVDESGWPSARTDRDR